MLREGQKGIIIKNPDTHTQTRPNVPHQGKKDHTNSIKANSYVHRNKKILCIILYENLTMDMI